MLIYNVTAKVTWAIHEKWMQWMKEKHIPEVMATGCFTGNQVLRLLETDEAEGPTYAIQYRAEKMEDYQEYISTHAPAFRKELTERWGDNFIAFRSLMEVVG